MTIPRSKYHANLPPFADYLTRLYLDHARSTLSLKTKVAKSVDVINLLPLYAT